MHQPLLSPQERHYLALAILQFLAATAPATASQLAYYFNYNRNQIHSVLIRLRARGLIEAVDLRSKPGWRYLEYLWRVTEHARFHDPRAIFPGTPRCKYCQRIYPEL